MPDLAAHLAVLSDLHFLRPWALLLLPVGVGLFLWLRRLRDITRQMRGLVAPHLLRHLVVTGGPGERFRPEHLLLIAFVLGGIALAGPTHEREVPPFVDDQAALVVVVDVSTTMNAIDVAPTRLERAKQKMRDLLEQRPGARTGLVAYAGSAHVVLPLTEDAGILETYVDALSTDVMPVRGDRPDEALALAQDLLTTAKAPGSILFFADGIPADARPAFQTHRDAGGAPVLLLALATERGGPVKKGKQGFETDADGSRLVARLDTDGLDATPGLWWTGVTVDDSDVDRALGKVEQHLATAQAGDDRWQWRDLGSLFLWPLVLLVPLWFRRGWTVRWAAALLLLGAFVGGGEPAYAHDSVWQRLWRTPDQQGRWHYERGEYEDAASHFLDPMWKGVSLYRLARYEEAVDQFALVTTPEAFFNLGNTYAQLKRWPQAIASYRKVLEKRPDNADAKANLDLVKRLQAHEQKKKDEEPAEGGDTLGADEVVIDDGTDDRKRPEVEEEVTGGAMEEAMEEIWMRQIQTTPAGFLAGKFAVQAQERQEDER